MGVSRADIGRADIGVDSSKPFARFANSVAMREAAFQGDTANTLNMEGALQGIAQRTGMQGTINPSEIPSVAGLANTQAYAVNSSNLRSAGTTATVKSLPGYIKSYRNYLQWRYPSRYGGAKGTNYTTDFTQSGYEPEDLPDPFTPSTFKYK